MNPTILLLASLQGLLLSLALLLKRSKSYYSNFFLGLIVTVISLELLFYWQGVSGYNNFKNAFPVWVFSSYLVLPPALWLYLKINTDVNFSIKRGYLFLFLPAILQIGILFSSRIFPGNSYFHLLLAKSAILSGAWFFLTEIVPIIWMAFVIASHTRKLSFAYAAGGLTDRATRFQLRKLYVLLGFFAVTVLLWAMLVLLHAPVLRVVEGLLVAFVFALAYTAYFKPDFFEIPRAAPAKHKHPDHNDEIEWQRLCELFEKEAIYCRPRLSLNELAIELKLPARYVSYLINTNASCNFQNFVNVHRVNETIKRIKDPAHKHKTLVGIAMETGFSSKSAFNQVFKQITGKTPSEYLG